MSFFPGGFHNAGFYTVTPADLAVAEGYLDVFAAVIEITFTTADLAVTEGLDVAAFVATVITNADMAVVGPVDDVLLVGLVIADILDFSVDEAPDVMALLGIVSTDADFAVTEADDIDDLTLVVSTLAGFAVTDFPDEFDGRAFVGYFFLPEQEIIYVAEEPRVMTVPYDSLRVMRIAAKPVELEELPEDRVIKTKKRNRSKVLQ